jgi:predicted metal-binding protein
VKGEVKTTIMTAQLDLVELALEKGASEARITPAEEVAVADVIRLKCQYGCPHFGQYLTCPPHSPTPETMRAVLGGFQHVLLVKFEVEIQSADMSIMRQPQKVLVELEQQLALAQYPLAFALWAGPCLLCEGIECAGEPGRCRHPAQARPSMEGCGIDVYSTVRKAGMTIRELGEVADRADIFGMVLLE